VALDLRQQLAAQFPQLEHQLAFYARGSKHPPYNHKDVRDSLSQFCEQILPLSPLKDPRNKEIKIVKGNFPKLADLEHKTLTRDEFPASQIVKCIEEGTFDPSDYQTPESSRISTLFWLPELVQDPDAIYRNGHKIIAGNEIYVRVYDKQGRRVKLLFTMDIKNAKNGELIRTVPVTSFMTDSQKVIDFISGQPLYARK
jgi:hypothetical protein